jgi:hypothetical protein
MRGNAQQLMDKYLALGRDASAQGDRVLAENYFQHADHYYRVINARFEGQQNNNQQRRFNGPQGGYDGQDGYNDFNRSDIPPGPSQNLIPGGAQPFDQPQPPQQQQMQPGYDAGSFQPQVQPQPQQQREPEGDIGLPPQLFGGQQSAPRQDDQPATSEQQSNGQGSGDNRGFRPRHQGRRRFGPRRDGQQQAETGGDAS